MIAARCHTGAVVRVSDDWLSGCIAAMRGRPEPDFCFHSLAYGDDRALSIVDGWRSWTCGAVAGLVEIDDEGAA